MTDMLAGLGVVAAIHVKTTGGALARRSGQRDGALRLSEVDSQHAQGDRSATADGIGHSVGQLMEASVYTRIAAVDAEMAWCNSAVRLSEVGSEHGQVGRSQ